jgi:serine phosphatase RsbU (regulator of sigma subunit)
LKLYTEPPPVDLPPASSFTTLPAVLDAFQQATGWALQYTPAPNAGLPAPNGRRKAEEQSAQLTLARVPSSPRTVPLESAQALAAALARLLGEAIGLEQALWQREAELATAMPLVPAANEGEHLAQRLEAVLQGGAEAIGCHAAGLYLLDEATSQLKLRACWGLPRTRLAAPARPLRGAVADLEALLGSAVVLEHPEMMAPWHAPEDFSAAICVPLSSATTILGTLWIFSRRPRRFSDRHTNLAEIVAGRLAADLEREILLDQGIEAARWRSQRVAAENLQRDQLPTTPPQIDGWQLAGWTEQADDLGGDFFDWFSRSDDTTVVTLGDATGRGLPGALVASALKATLRSHGQYLASPDQVLHQANQTLWAGSAGDQQAAALVAFLRPNDGRLQYSAAGPIRAIVVDRQGSAATKTATACLGEVPESRYPAGELDLQPGQVAVLFTEPHDTAGVRLSEMDIAGVLLPHLAEPARQLAQLLRECLTTAGERPLAEDCTVVVLKRGSAHG